MNPLLPVEVFALEIQPGEVVPLIDAPGAFRITMAAIDPTEEPFPVPGNPNAPPRATLKMIRHFSPLGLSSGDDYLDDLEDLDDDEIAAIERRLGLDEDFDEDDEEEDEDDEDEDDEDDEGYAGPSDPKKAKNARLAVNGRLVNGDIDEDVDMDLPNGLSSSKRAKGKARAVEEDGDEDEDEDDEDEDDDIDDDDAEVVLCSLDTSMHLQQPLDITVIDTSSVSFKVVGTHSIHLTGNFVEVPEDDDDSEEDEDEDYMNGLDNLVAPYGEEDSEVDEDDEDDELDDLEDPRILELDDDDEETEAPKLVKAAASKGKNKRPAESDDEEANDLDNLISKTLKTAGSDAATNGEQKLSKKQLKKLKKNDGQAAAATSAAKEEAEATKKPATKDSPGNGKKVQFAKELEQGPTPSPKVVDAKKDSKPNQTGVKVVQGVTIDERKEGSGPMARKNDRIAMRYIGKLENGRVFDSNKKGKPFTFKLGSGEVIKGWDVGLAGVKVGGERRITIPASMAYGSQKLPDIPPNSTLVFDVKCLSIN